MVTVRVMGMVLRKELVTNPSNIFRASSNYGSTSYAIKKRCYFIHNTLQFGSGLIRYDKKSGDGLMVFKIKSSGE